MARCSMGREAFSNTAWPHVSVNQSHAANFKEPGHTPSQLYISELSPPKARGFMVSLAELSINIGILVGFFFGWALRNVAHQWRWMLGGMINSNAEFNVWAFDYD